MQPNNLSNTSLIEISTVALDDVFRLFETDTAEADEQIDRLLADLATQKKSAQQSLDPATLTYFPEREKSEAS